MIVFYSIFWWKTYYKIFVKDYTYHAVINFLKKSFNAEIAIQQSHKIIQLHFHITLKVLWSENEMKSNNTLVKYV